MKVQPRRSKENGTFTVLGVDYSCKSKLVITKLEVVREWKGSNKVNDTMID